MSTRVQGLVHTLPAAHLPPGPGSTVTHPGAAVCSWPNPLLSPLPARPSAAEVQEEGMSTQDFWPPWGALAWLEPT